MQTLFYFVDDLLSKYGGDPTATYLLENRVLYICPVVNPDGYFRNQSTSPAGGGLLAQEPARQRRQRHGRPTSDGVDINRNFGYQWGFDNVGSSAARSRPRPIAAPRRSRRPRPAPRANIVVALQPKTGLSFHTYSDLLLRPWGYTVAAPPDSSTLL